MSRKFIKNIVLEDAIMRFKNFSGKAGDYNPAGRRNFCVLLDPAKASELREEGWNIKVLQPREEGDDPVDYLQVTVSFDNVPPKIYIVTSKKKTLVDEDNVNVLDYAEIIKTDCVISPYFWERQGKTGIKAYLKSMYVTIAEDEFADKYADIPDSAVDTICKDDIPIEDEDVPFN